MNKLVKWTFISLITSIVSMIAHNMFYAVGVVGEDKGIAILKYISYLEVPFFFLTLIAFPAMIVLSVIIAYKQIRYKNVDGAWYLGFIGLALLIFFFITGMNRIYGYIFIPLPWLLFFVFYWWK